MDLRVPKRPRAEGLAEEEDERAGGAEEEGDAGEDGGENFGEEAGEGRAGNAEMAEGGGDEDDD